MLISNTQRSCVMHSTGVLHRVSRGYEGWQGFAGIWATSNEDSRMCWRGLFHLSRLDCQGVFEFFHAGFEILDLTLLLFYEQGFNPA
jgi:hypothetical protein